MDPELPELPPLPPVLVLRLLAAAPLPPEPPLPDVTDELSLLDEVAVESPPVVDDDADGEPPVAEE